jgi:hypothetical protein
MGMVQQQQSKCKMELEEELNGYRIGAAQQEDWFSAVIRNTKDPNLRKSFGVLLDLSLAMPGHFLLPYLFFIVVDEFFFVVRHDDGCVCDFNAATRPELLSRLPACSARVVVGVASHHDKNRMVAPATPDVSLVHGVMRHDFTLARATIDVIVFLPS